MRPIFHLVLATAMMSSAAIQPAPAQDDATAYLVTYIDALPAAESQSATLLKQLADASRKDAGNVRFDVLQQTARTNHFTVVEVWTDQKSSDAHELTAHGRQYRSDLAPMIGALYDQRFYKPL